MGILFKQSPDDMSRPEFCREYGLALKIWRKGAGAVDSYSAEPKRLPRVSKLSYLWSFNGTLLLEPHLMQNSGILFFLEVL